MLSQKIKKIFIYLIGIIIILYIVKPNIIFKSNKHLRQYGFGIDNQGYKKTLFTMQNIIIFSTLILYIITK